MSTSVGTPQEPDNGQAPAPAARRDLRDSLWGRALILGALLLFTLLVSKTCASNSDEITQDEAVQIAIDAASFTPCEPEICRQVRFLNQGIPPRGFWGVVLSEDIVNGQPTRTESFLVNAATGDVEKQ